MDPASALRQKYAGTVFNTFQGSAGGVRVLREEFRCTDASMLSQPRHFIGIQMDDFVVAATAAAVARVRERTVACIALLL
jgi:hypothetical protein